MFSSCFLNLMVLKLIRIQGNSPVSIGTQKTFYLNEVWGLVVCFFFQRRLGCCARFLLGYSENWRLFPWASCKSLLSLGRFSSELW